MVPFLRVRVDACNIDTQAPEVDPRDAASIVSFDDFLGLVTEGVLA
jgi:hypothetical protein